MFSKAGQIVLASGVVLLALYDAGPKVVGEPCLKRLIGSEADPVPVLPFCNTTGLKDVGCASMPGKVCSLTYKKCKQPNYGILQDKLCDPNNGDLKCIDENCIPANEDLLSTQPCEPHRPK
ncbi:MAG: hypothetical protein KatS3mg107_0642 [Gemmataceae bacterium]|jgi:hypothetical protein|nr:MAG: hypothetical protein KatS3mg107_0642 [Gemmataceae bacterium]